MKNILFFICCFIFNQINGQVALKLQLSVAQPIGDIDAITPTVNGGQLSALYDLNSHFSIFGSFNYNSVKGKDPQHWLHETFGGGLVESYYQSDINYIWRPSFSSNVYTLSSGMLFNLNLINNINIHIGPGFGITHASTYVDLLDENHDHYKFTIEKPIGIKDDEYDEVYETNVTDLPSLVFILHFTAGIDYNINERLALSLDYSRMVLYTDYLDGIKFRTAFDETYSYDNIHFISLGVKYKFVKKAKS